jgi:hypothetical protein
MYLGLFNKKHTHSEINSRRIATPVSGFFPGKHHATLIKALFEADLIRSFQRTRHHDIRWKGFSPEGALDGVDLSLPLEERTRALW